MAKKRNFAVKIKAPGQKDIIFTGKNCEVKDKSLSARLQIENPYRETLECDDVEFTTLEETKTDVETLKKQKEKKVEKS